MTGFTKVDNDLFEKLLTGGLTKRQIKIVLLVVRFSAGYQKAYAVLRKKDFGYAGVAASCIAAEIATLQRKGVLLVDPEMNTYRINPSYGRWAVENPVDSRGKFFGIASVNSMKRQLASLRNVNREKAESASNKERQRKNYQIIETRFREAAKEYLTHIAPLSPDEAQGLREAVKSHGLQHVVYAIRSLAQDGDRSFARFVKSLDASAPRSKRTGLASLRSSLERYRVEHPQR